MHHYTSGFAPALSVIERMVNGRDARLTLTDRRSGRLLSAFGTDCRDAAKGVHGKPHPANGSHPTSGKYTLVGRLADGQGFEVALSIRRTRGQAAFGENESRLAKRLTPHLLHAARARFEVCRLRFRMEIGMSALDELDMAVIVTDASGRVWFANGQAEAMLAAGDTLERRDGCLRETAPVRSRGLASLLAAAANQSCSGDMPIKSGSRGKSYLARAFPLKLNPPPTELWQTPLALLLVSDPATNAVLPCQTLRACFGLTEKEAGLALAVGEGRTAEEYAGEKGVRVTTVRTQLRAIFAKNNVRGQVELVRLLGRIPKGRCSS
jgi:DNA-binding CsgD family transcriptional regulator/PAS domain-containing protein